MAGLRDRLGRLRRRLRRIERREQSALRRWIEHTDNLLHVSVLLLVPLTIAGVTALANATPSLSFLLFPPLASGAYTMFANPEGRYASPIRFVAGLTIGAVCGWIAFAAFGQPGADINAWAAGTAVLLTGVVTWLLDVEEPSGYAAALLLLVQEAPPGIYVLSVAVASAIVAGVFVAWHDVIYEQRAEFLYASTGRDDDVLVPMIQGAEPVARLGARIAGGHEQGRLILLGLLEPEDGPAAAGTAAGEENGDDEQTAEPAETATDDQWADANVQGSEGPEVVLDEQIEGTAVPRHGPQTDQYRDGPSAADQRDRERDLVARLEQQAATLAEESGAQCEVVVARGQNTAKIVRETATETGADLILGPFSAAGADGLVTTLFASELDVGAARVERERWLNVLVPIRSAGDLAHRKVDIARRIAGGAGHVTVAHCIGSEAERRSAEEMCANVVDAYEGRFETVVANDDIESFLRHHAPSHDLIVLGASTDRSPVSRLLSRPTYERVKDVETDLLVVHAGRP